MLKRTSNGTLVDFTGKRKHLIMLHGLGCASNRWEASAHSLAGRFTVIRYDMRAAGRSPVDGEFSLAQLLRSLGALFSALALDSAHLLGHSLGALIGLYFAGEYPKWVKKIDVAGTNLGANAERRAAVLSREQKVRQHGIADLVDATLASGLAPATLSGRPLAIALASEMMLAQSVDGYPRSLEGMANAAPADPFRIRVPILALAGADDPISPHAISQERASSIAGGSAVVFPSCGHRISIEQPSLTRQQLYAFF